jgi:hypothetical protein
MSASFAFRTDRAEEMTLMKTQRKLLVIAGMSGFALTTTLVTTLAQVPNLQPMVVHNLTGNLRIEQPIPCTDDVDQFTPVTGGRIEITPSDGIDVPGGKSFVLSRVNVSFAPFSIHRSCLTVDRTRNYTEISVQLSRAVQFTGVHVGGGVYDVTIAPENFLIYQAAIVNGDLETAYKHPKEPVTATIDLTTGAIQMRVAIGTRVKFKAGCVDPCPIGSCEVCVVDDTTEGTLTATLAGTLVFPDSDADGVPDRADNCRFVSNADQSPVATPVVTPPAAITLSSCEDHAIGTAIASDVCDATPVTVSSNAPSRFLVGPNTVTWTGVDGKGRTGTATQTVTVVDTTNPVFTFVPGPIALNNCVAADLGTPIAVDDCAGTPTLSNNAPPIFPVGATIVTWTAKDMSNNMSTATQTVTVTDTVAPTVTCLPDPAPGGAFIASSIDACTAAPTLKLGTFDLALGEKIKIEETGRPGIRLVNTVNGIRHFQVGAGEGIIVSTDGSGNVSSASCPRR